MRRKKEDKLGWEHHPGNDVLPEHYSSPFGIVYRENDRWYAFTTTAAYGVVRGEGELRVAQFIGSHAKIQSAKEAVAKVVERSRLKARGVAVGKK